MIREVYRMASQWQIDCCFFNCVNSVKLDLSFLECSVLYDSELGIGRKTDLQEEEAKQLPSPWDGVVGLHRCRDAGVWGLAFALHPTSALPDWWPWGTAAGPGPFPDAWWCTHGGVDTPESCLVQNTFSSQLKEFWVPSDEGRVPISGNPDNCWWSVIVKVNVTQSCLTLFIDPMDYTAHGILQARILEWVAFPFSRGSSQPRDRTQVSSIAGGSFTNWAIRWLVIIDGIYWSPTIGQTQGLIYLM